ncbi:hypothetical protein [Rathayibacter sp. VKM Ac-2760]|uniref:hypothetical protein n=1 Tax=Rathayibacter sp. VKM Ac-2760 TaxID=2609253 RepID=UPI0013181A76|nr:hypothetical protein [Rathayibacter sp. VKM Ac-2760]QHC61052.1 hypothetical protein GSU72_20205 [Rathayibacter sp. VKM Ac-2760]
MPQIAARITDTELLAAQVDPSSSRTSTLDLGDSIELFLAGLHTSAGGTRPRS